jgi:hypothetical protein
MKLDDTQRSKVLSDIKRLQDGLESRDLKYNRSYNRMMFNSYRISNIRQIHTLPPSFFNRGWGDADTGIVPTYNVGKAMAETLTSKLIQTKGRVFFDSVNGLWRTIKITRSAQVYFDAFSDVDHITESVEKCVHNANVFDTGVMWTDEETKRNIPVQPWQFYCDPNEFNYKRTRRALLVHDDYPLSAIVDKIKGTKLEATYNQNQGTTCTLKRYWDINAHIKVTFANDVLLEAKTVEYNRIPFAFYFYQKPLKGFYTNSVLDNVFSIQRQIDDILLRVHDALTLNPVSVFFVPGEPNQANSMAKWMDSKAGLVIPFNPALGGVPIPFAPTPFNSQYDQQLQSFVQKAFDQEGISQLSATSKIPSNATSGKMVDTVQDIESERFQSQVDGLIQFYKDIYDNMIEVFPAEDDILPPSVNRSKTKWSEIKKSKDSFTLQSSLASVLSKDPQTKMEQVEKLQAQGVINPYMAAEILEIPDINKVYASATASYDYCQQIIERAIEDGSTDFYYSFVDLNQLLNISVNMLCQLASAGESDDVINRLVNLIGVTSGKIKEVGNIQNPPMGPPPPPPMDVQDTALNGAQIDGVSRVLQGVATGSIPPASAKALILISLPNAPVDQIDAMLLPFGLAPTPVPQAPPPEAPPVPVV